MPTKKIKKPVVVNEKPSLKRKWHPSRYFSMFSLVLLVLVALIVGTLKLIGLSTSSFFSSTSETTVSSPAAPTVTGGVATDSVKVADTASSQNSSAEIIQTGSFAATVTNVDTAVADLEALAIKQKGSVENSQVLHNSPDCNIGGPTATGFISIPEKSLISCASYDATVTLKVPAEKFAETRDAIRRLDENQQLDSEQTSTVDVTDTTKQVATSLAAAETEQTALQDLLTKATNVDDIIKIRAQLATVKAEIQNLTNQKENLQKNVSYATLTVTLNEASTTTVVAPSLSARFALAWTSFQQSMSALGTLLIYVLVYAVLYIPLLAIIGVIIALVVRFVHRHRK